MAQEFCRTADRHNFTSTKQVSDNPAIKWKFKTNGNVFSSPILYNNILLTGSCDSNLYALKNTDGKLLWRI
jgi:outer membrane protein assembly factor BamB